MAARAVGILLLASAGFALRATLGAVTVRQARRRVATPPICCICINCKWVDRCKTYHWVEQMHEQPHVTDAPDFDPNDPQIQVFIRKEGVETAEVAVEAGDGSPGQTTAVKATLSTEYDVFGCDAFEEDAGKWLRLMPDADFIPT